MAGILVRQAELIAGAVAAHGGVRPEEQGEGDSVFAAFALAVDAVLAAVEAQRRLDEEPWPDGVVVRVRMAVHSGDAILRGERNYGGLTVHRTARLRSLAHGGQVLVSSTTVGLLGDDVPAGLSFRDLGEHALKDLSRPERVFQVLGEGLADDFPPLRGVGAPQLPAPVALATFVGRERELTDVCSLLRTNRLLTVTGVGGAGKTRLAAQAATRAAEALARVWWIDLASVTIGEPLDPRVLAMTGGREELGRSPRQVLVDRVGEAPTMLVLDNCEHVVESVAGLVEELLAGSTTTVCLATSREPLGITGEAVYRLPPMELPEPGDGLSPEEAERYDGVRLFVDRARLVQPGFRLDQSTTAPVVEVCRRLDALPLAIELAAARTRMMSPTAIARSVDDRFRLLGGGSRTATRRQQTLRASVDWSYDLLSEPERVVLNRLGVFIASFPLSGGIHVAGDGLSELDVVDALDKLVDKSLVQAEVEGDEPRYRLLETIREYALERLEDAGELGDVRDRHLSWCAGMCRAAAVGLEGPGLVDWMSALSLERPNLTAGFEWAIERRAASDLWAMCGALTFWWVNAGHFHEAARWFDACVSAADDVPAAAQLPARWGATYLAFYAGDFERGLTEAQGTLALAREVGDDRYTARALSALGTVTMFGDAAAAEAELTEAADLARQARDDWCLADTLQNLAIVVYARGDLRSALSWYDEALPLARRLGHVQLLAWDRAGRGLCKQRLGQLREAVELLDAATELANRTGDPNIVATVLAWRASTAALLGEAAEWTDRLASTLERCLTVGAGQGALVVAADSIRVRLAAGDLDGTEAMISQWLPTIGALAPAMAAGSAPLVAAATLGRAEREEARRRIEQGRAWAEESGLDINRALVTLAKAVLDLVDGDLDGAQAAVLDVLPRFAAEPFPLELVDGFSLLGAVDASRGAHLDAARAWGTADGIAAGCAIAWTPLRPWTEAARGEARAAAGTAPFDQAISEGRARGIDDAVAWALRTHVAGGA